MPYIYSRLAACRRLNANEEPGVNQIALSMSQILLSPGISIGLCRSLDGPPHMGNSSLCGHPSVRPVYVRLYNCPR